MIAAVQLLALHLEILGYILFLLYGFLYFRSLGDLIGESLILRWLLKILYLEAPYKFIDNTEWSFKGETVTVGNRELNLEVEREICKEEAECSLIGEIVIFNLLVIPI